MEKMEDSIVFLIPSEQFEPLLGKYPELSLRFLSEISKRLRDQEELVEKLVFRDLSRNVVIESASYSWDSQGLLVCTDISITCI